MKRALRRQLLGLPVDARPVVRAQVQELVASAGWRLHLPEVAALGHFRQAADRDALQLWLQQNADQADGLVLSLDMLVYGGLVPSRFCEDTLPHLLQRLDFVRQIKAAQPGRVLVAFLATMRLSNNNEAAEEKAYWAQYGTHLWAWSYHSDRAKVLGAAALGGGGGGGASNAADATESTALADAAAAHIPSAVRDDYRATRARNFAVTLAALQATEDGVIDRLVLPQDDTATWGLNIAERRELQARVQARNLQDRVLIYPGADEVMHTLCAHLVQRLEGQRPLRVALAYSDPAHVGQLSARYEDRPLLESVASQLRAVGANTLRMGAAVHATDTPGLPCMAGNADTPDRRDTPDTPGTPEQADAQADVLLAVHTQGTAQGDWAMQLPLPQRPGVAPGWFARLHAAQQRGQPVVLVDLAFANGGDPWLLARLHAAQAQQGGDPSAGASATDARAATHAPSLPPLFSYAGWNTASNSLGGALAHATLAHAGQQRTASNDATSHARICALRLFEDGLYQAQLRQALRGAIDESKTDADSLQRIAQDLVLPWANTWAAGLGLGWRVHSLRLPWGRSFEVDLQLVPAP